jgi:2-oxoglutarate ferredoxin oxidoreductase subunit gamma
MGQAMGHEIVMAGFGGQGVMSIGQMLAYAAMRQGLQVSYVPSYGPEMRGGTANCMVMISDRAVGSPVTSSPTAAIVMSKESIGKFEPVVRKGGCLVVNSSLITRKATREDITVIEVPANELAAGLGSDRVANMVALGALVGYTDVVNVGGLVEALKKVLPAHRHNLIPINEQALARGMEIGRAARRRPS